MSTTLPAGVPETAIPFPPTNQTPFPDVQVVWVQSVQSVVAHSNEVAADNYRTACDNWVLRNTHNRELGLKIDDKPVAPAAKVVNVILDQSTVDPTTGAGLIYVWVSPGDPVGPACPDLPPVPAKPPVGNSDIGVHTFGNFYQAKSDDTVSPETLISVSEGNSAGIPAGQYRKGATPFGGFYEKVA